MKKKLKCFLFIIILLFLYIFINAYSYVYAISNNLSNNVLRLHIIANSNSEEDQNLKYIIRDNILEYMNTLCFNCASKKEAINIMKENLNNFKEIAEKTIKKQGFSYNITVELGNFKFPTKTYGDISFPAGYYDSLQVKIGESNGQNWWCVMFPPLCFINPTNGIVPDESKETLQNNLNNEEFKIISESTKPDISVKFKFIELFEKTGLLTSKNN